MQPTDSNSPLTRRLTFDPTINAGHVLSFIGMLTLVVGGWVTLDKRVVVLEENKRYQEQRDNTQDAILNAQLADIKEAVREVRRGVDELRRDTANSKLGNVGKP